MLPGAGLEAVRTQSFGIPNFSIRSYRVGRLMPSSSAALVRLPLLRARAFASSSFSRVSRASLSPIALIPGAGRLHLQIRRGDLRPLGHDHGTLDAVLQLPDVSRPGILLDGINRLIGKSLDLFSVFVCVAFQEGFGQEDHIPLPFPQGREGHQDDPQAKVKVFPEAPFLHGLFEIAVCGRNDAGIHLDLLPAADPFDHPLLQEAKQLHLEGQRQLADLVQKEGAPIGHFEAPLALDVRPGEGALLMAEKLALQEVFGNGAAVDHDERIRLTDAEPVHGAGHELLAGAAFPHDQDGGVRGRHLPDDGEDLLHLSRRSPASPQRCRRSAAAAAPAAPVRAGRDERRGGARP